METTMETVTCTIWGDTFRLRANWAEASSQVERETEDGWKQTGYQVADFCHSPERAMRRELEMACAWSLDDPGDPRNQVEISEAIEAMS